MMTSSRMTLALALFITIWLSACGGGSNNDGDEDESVSETTSPSSDTKLSLKDVVEFTIPSSTFSSETKVTASKINEEALKEIYEETSTIFSSKLQAEYQIRIAVGTEQPKNAILADVLIPEQLRNSATPKDEIRVLYINSTEAPPEQHQSVELISVRALPSADKVSVEIPLDAFYPNSEGNFHAELLLALTPTAREGAASVQRARILAAAEDECLGKSIVSPVDSSFAISSPYGRRPRPKAGASENHKGIDYDVPVNTPVLAASDGKITKVKVNNGGLDKGYGYYVEITHDDGSVSRYAHLSDESSLPIGTKVTAGQEFAKSGNTGNSTDAHLHFEYAPTGFAHTEDGRVDPSKCIGSAVGAIVVSDNGTALDDSFIVSFEGFTCTTPLGGESTCTIGRLRPGSYALSITALIAPDNVGTFLITITTPGVTINGGSSVSGRIPQGGSAQYEVLVQ